MIVETYIIMLTRIVALYFTLQYIWAGYSCQQSFNYYLDLENVSKKTHSIKGKEQRNLKSEVSRYLNCNYIVFCFFGQ